MKITKAQRKQIIKEEILKEIGENYWGDILDEMPMAKKIELFGPEIFSEDGLVIAGWADPLSYHDLPEFFDWAGFERGKELPSDEEIKSEWEEYKEVVGEEAEHYKPESYEEEIDPALREKIKKSILRNAKNNMLQDNYGGTWNEALEKAVNDYGDDFPEYMEVAFEIGDELKVDED